MYFGAVLSKVCKIISIQERLVLFSTPHAHVFYVAMLYKQNNMLLVFEKRFILFGNQSASLYNVYMGVANECYLV